MSMRGRRLAAIFLLFIVFICLPFYQSILSSVQYVVDGTGNVLSERIKSGAYRPAISYHGHDLMNDPPIKFNPNFKNPCWYEDEELRCLPYMFLIGVKKCGTGELFKRTSLHPDFKRSGFKEAQWFARGRFSNASDDTFKEYINMFRKATQIISRDMKDKQNFKQITGEASPSNLHLNTHWKYLPGNENMDEPKYVILDYIHHFIPNAKIMVLFRDPVERLYSDYYHEYGTLVKNRGEEPNPTIQHFHKVVKKGLKEYKDCFQHHTVRSCVYNPVIYNGTLIQIQLGIYYIFWQDLLRTFPRKQILVLQNKNLRDMETTMKSVYKFLDLRKLSKKRMMKVVNANRKPSYPRDGPMMNTTLKLLQKFYAPFNKRMAAITGDSNFLYGYE